MKCHSCGKDAQPDQVDCSYCGASLMDGASPTDRNSPKDGALGGFMATGWPVWVAVCVAALIITIAGYNVWQHSAQSEDPEHQATFRELVETKRTQYQTERLEREAEDERRRAASTEQDREKHIRVGFSDWDGSHRALTRHIRSNLTNPASYEHIDTQYVDQGAHLVVTTRYRARNSAGDMVPGTVVARTKIGGAIIEIISSE